MAAHGGDGATPNGAVAVTPGEGLAAIRALVYEQAEDEGLWFVAETAPEAYLQGELRRLHALVESVTEGGEDG